MQRPERTRFRTTDPAEATAAARAALGGGSFTGVEDRLPFAQTAVSFQGVVEGRMEIGAQASAYLADGYPAPFLMMVRSGGMSVRQGATPVGPPVLTPGSAALLAPDRATWAELHHPDLDFLQMGGEELERVAREAFPEARRVVFGRTSPRSPAATTAVLHAARAVRLVLASDDLSESPLIVGSTLRHLSAVVLDAFGAAPSIPDRHRGSSAVERAVRFIEANITRPLTVHDIAAAAGVSVRTLQQMFRAEREETPHAYLARARLHAVRLALLRADAGHDTVAVIARTWGFRGLGRFAAAYREAFGENPSATLRR